MKIIPRANLIDKIACDVNYFRCLDRHNDALQRQIQSIDVLIIQDSQNKDSNYGTNRLKT